MTLEPLIIFGYMKSRSGDMMKTQSSADVTHCGKCSRPLECLARESEARELVSAAGDGEQARERVSVCARAHVREHAAHEYKTVYESKHTRYCICIRVRVSTQCGSECACPHSLMHQRFESHRRRSQPGAEGLVWCGFSLGLSSVSQVGESP